MYQQTLYCVLGMQSLQSRGPRPQVFTSQQEVTDTGLLRAENYCALSPSWSEEALSMPLVFITWKREALNSHGAASGVG